MSESESKSTGRLLLEEKDFVSVVDEEGNELDYRVPKHWDNTELAAGVKKKSGRGKTAAPADPDAEPAGNASRADWAAYATRVKGAEVGDLVDEDGKDLSRDDLAAKFGTPS